MPLDTRKSLVETSRQSVPDRRCFLYSLYGVTLRSTWKLPYTACDEARPPVIELGEGDPALFEEAARETAGRPVEDDWFQYARLGDGASYLRWPGLYDFLISADGSRILGRAARADIAPESFHTYLLGVALSFSLIQLGVDPLHATVVASNGSAIGFLGKSGYGKSTLAGAFLQAGYSMVTDDLVALRREKDGYSAYPGPPRIKLLPETAQMLLGKRAQGTPMNPLTRKWIILLDQPKSQQTAVPLKKLYVLNFPLARARSTGKITLRRLSHQRALLALLENSYNDWVSERARLNSQFSQYAQIASKIPVKGIYYPRRLQSLSAVREAILADLER